MIPMRKSPEIQTKFGKCNDDFISNFTSAVIYELIALGAFLFKNTKTKQYFQTIYD